MDLLKQLALSESGEFMGRIRQGIIAASIAVLRERPENSPEGIAQHAKRAAHAIEVLQDPIRWARPWAAMVVTNPAITAESSDGDLEWTIAQMFDPMAGVILSPLRAAS